MLHLLFYTTDPAMLHRAAELFQAHRARIDEFHARGELLLVGVFEDPTQGALGVFTTAEAARSFAEGDPFVLEGVVAAWRIQGWREVLGADR